jgi:hypothetical protein
MIQWFIVRKNDFNGLLIRDRFNGFYIEDVEYKIEGIEE